MRKHAEIMADLNSAKEVAKKLNLENVEPRDVTDAHKEAAKSINALIREHNQTWIKRGASNSSDDHEEWKLFKMSDTDGTEMSAWVSCYV